MMTDGNYYLKAVNTGEFELVKKGSIWRLKSNPPQNPNDYLCAYVINSGTEPDIKAIQGINFPGYTPLDGLDRRGVSNLQEVLDDVSKGSGRSWTRLVGRRLFLSANEGIRITPPIVSVKEFYG